MPRLLDGPTFSGDDDEGAETRFLMSGPADNRAYLISYLSLAKLEQVCGQISDFDVQKVKQASDTKIKGKVGAKLAALFQLFSGSIDASAERQMVSTKEGQVNSFNKLRQVIGYYEKGGNIADLRECIASRSSPEDTILYRYNGEFTVNRAPVDKSSITFTKNEEKKENSVPVYAYQTNLATSQMCVLTSKINGFALQIACSLKFFSDMGSSRHLAKGKKSYSDEDTFDIHPHSGNHHFFSGEGSSHFDALIFITGQEGKRLFGSPLVLFQNFAPNFKSRRR
jgi:hypothetical protein